RQRRQSSWQRSALGGFGGAGDGGVRTFRRRLGLVLDGSSLGLGLGGGLVSLVGSLLGGCLLLLGRGGLGARAALGLGQRGVEQIQLAQLGLLDLQRALRAGQTLELLPVAGDLQQLEDGFGGLGAD